MASSNKEHPGLYRHRQEVLLGLVKDVASGNVSEFCRVKTLPYKSITSYLSGKGERFGRLAARRLEKDLGLPTYYFDEGGPGFIKPSPPIAPDQLDALSVMIPTRELAELGRLYLMSSERKRKRIMLAAQSEDVDAGEGAHLDEQTA